MSQTPAFRLERRDKKTGFREEMIFIGYLYNKPRGWKAVKQIGMYQDHE